MSKDVFKQKFNTFFLYMV